MFERAAAADAALFTPAPDTAFRLRRYFSLWLTHACRRRYCYADAMLLSLPIFTP